MKRGFIIAALSNGNIRLMLDIAKRAGRHGMPFSAPRSLGLTSRCQKRICAPQRF
jgi:hypothetical protein